MPVSLSDILAIIFGITTAILGLGQIIVTCLIRQSRRRSGNAYFYRKVYSIFELTLWNQIDTENGSDIYRTHVNIPSHEGIIRVLELWSRLGHVQEHEYPD